MAEKKQEFVVDYVFIDWFAKPVCVMYLCSNAELRYYWSAPF